MPSEPGARLAERLQHSIQPICSKQDVDPNTRHEPDYPVSCRKEGVLCGVGAVPLDMGHGEPRDIERPKLVLPAIRRFLDERAVWGPTE